MPMNPKLYESLKRRFGDVIVSNPDERAILRQMEDPYRKGKFKSVVLQNGEYYRVCCPFCGDTRHRLYINYRWQTVDKQGQKAGYHLAHCFNEQCDLFRLPDELKGYLSRVVLDRPHHEKLQTAVEYQPVELPGVCVPLHELPVNHKAVQYVEQRDFDYKELGRVWELHYCMHCEKEDARHPNLVRNRLIIPIKRHGVLVGWQARTITDGYPKYYTLPNFKKSGMLFNMDRARNYKFGVVVEGPFDAFRVGERAVALLGKSMSNTQRELILSFWSSGSLCVMLDPDALEDMERVTKLLNPRAFRLGAFSAILPDGKDPADMDSDQLWGLLSEYARSKGIQLV